MVETPKSHTVRVKYSQFSGTTYIWVDEELIYERQYRLFDIGLEHRFKLDGLPCIVRIFHRTWDYAYELWIDGKLQ